MADAAPGRGVHGSRADATPGGGSDVDSCGSSRSRDPFERLFSMAATGTRAPLGMPMDVYRGEDGSYHVETDMPGADPDSIEVTVEHGTVTIQAERTPHYGGSEQVIAAERPQGSFARRLALGEGVDAENLTAGLRRRRPGTWTIPASPKAQARRG